MMKRFSAIIALVALISSTLTAGDTLYFMEGVTAQLDLGVKTTDQSLDSLTNTMVSAYNDPNQVIVGQSQGGLRAMVYAEKMRQAGKGSLVKAVITIGSPVQGHWGLSRGKFDLANRYNTRYTKFLLSYTSIAAPIVFLGKAIEIFSPGNAPTLASFGLVGFNVKITDLLAFDTILTATGMTSVKENIAFLEKARTDPVNFGMGLGVVDEMIPGSSLMRNYVESGTHWEAGYWVQNLIGYGSYPVIVGWNWMCPIISWVSYPIYVPFYVLPAAKVDARMAPNMRLAHIVGTDNDPVNMVASASGLSQDALRGYKDSYATGMAVAGGVYYVLSLSFSGQAFTNPLALIPAIACGANSVACLDTAAFLAVLPFSVGIEFYLTLNNDGFVTSDQMTVKGPSWDLFAGTLPDTGAAWLTGNRLSSIYQANFNHASELTDPRIWGEGSMGSATVGSYGQLRDWFKQIGTLESTGKGKM